jgi:RNA polymerase sigma-70 factor (ECF subfamily)
VNASDGGAFALQLFELYGPAVRRYFRRQLGEASIADDLSQEVFLRVVRGAESYDPRARERAWIFRIARNVFLDHQRRAARSIERSSDADALTAPVQGVRLDVRRALGCLPSEEREAFLLGEIGGLTYAEIASLTSATVPAVRSRIYRARVRLRDLVIAPAPLPSRMQISRTDDE